MWQVPIEQLLTGHMLRAAPRPPSSMPLASASTPRSARGDSECAAEKCVSCGRAHSAMVRAGSAHSCASVASVLHVARALARVCVCCVCAVCLCVLAQMRDAQRASVVGTHDAAGASEAPRFLARAYRTPCHVVHVCVLLSWSHAWSHDATGRHEKSAYQTALSLSRITHVGTCNL